MRKFGLALAGLALLIGAPALWWQASRRTPTATALVETPTETTHHAPVLGAAPADLEGLRAPASTVEAAHGATDPLPVAAEATTGHATILTGTVIVVDDAGVEHRAEDGRFDLVLWVRNSGRRHEVEVHGGHWSTELSDAAEFLTVGRMVLGERAAAWDCPEHRLASPPDGRLEVRARWPVDSLLHVQDRETGRELAPVFLTELDSWPRSTFGHPGTQAAKARDLGPSPVRLPPRADAELDVRTCYARSPGYAWGRIEIDESKGGERLLLLDRAGTLDIEVSGTASDAGTKLRVFASSFAPVFESDLRPADTTTVEDLPAGGYRVVAEIGDHWDHPLILAEAAVDVVAGARAHAVLALKEPEALVVAPFEGTLFLPVEWKLGEFSLDFEFLGTARGGWDGRVSLGRGNLQEMKDVPGLYRWSLRSVPPGRYDVHLWQLSYHTILDVPAAGVRDARVVVPPPCDVLVRCVDDATGVDVTTEDVDWYCAAPEGVKAWSPQDTRWDADLRRFRFRCPQGEIVLGVMSSSYTLSLSPEPVRVRAGTNEVVLRLERVSSLAVRLRSGNLDIPWGDGLFPELVPADGQRSLRSMSYGTRGMTLHEREPGRYVLKIPAIPGYEPVPDTEVFLERGKKLEHVVELVRKR